MSEYSTKSTQEARQRAESKLAKAQQREDAFFAERRKLQNANAEKTARLKALRLAKEAVEREAAAKAAEEKAAAKATAAAKPKTRVSKAAKAAATDAA